MNKTMMDILACPIDKNYPLELHEIKEKDNVVSEGALFCSKCSRFYPIIEEIPIMLPDELRDKKLEMEFLKNNKDKLPEKISKSGLPWHL
ncbi:MAG: Trm112 family protein [Nitrosopumilus sp.]|nr:Trm112 family protein [Nitrosopumilus sp.]MDH3384583.1 Trm112 family protein [Nitrosopumilus sp.]